MLSSRPVEDIASVDFSYSSNNYLHINNSIALNVNNNKICNKSYIKLLDTINKHIIFVTDKGTFVLLTFKEFILCLN